MENKKFTFYGVSKGKEPLLKGKGAFMFSAFFVDANTGVKRLVDISYNREKLFYTDKDNSPSSLPIALYKNGDSWVICASSSHRCNIFIDISVAEDMCSFANVYKSGISVDGYSEISFTKNYYNSQNENKTSDIKRDSILINEPKDIKIGEYGQYSIENILIGVVYRKTSGENGSYLYNVVIARESGDAIVTPTLLASTGNTSALTISFSASGGSVNMNLSTSTQSRVKYYIIQPVF